MNILYIRANFPKLSETFILEELIRLKEMGHTVKVFASFGELHKVHPKVARHQMFDNVIYNRVFLDPADEPKTFQPSQNWSPKTSPWVFFKDFLHDQTARKEVFRKISQSKAQGRFSFLKDCRQFFQLAFHLKNVSIAANQFIHSDEIENFIPDIIHSTFATLPHLIVANKLAEKYGNIPYTVCFRAKDLYSTPEPDPAIRKALIYKAARVITISKYNEAFIHSTYPGLKGLSIIHSSIDTSFFSPDKNIGKNKNQIVSVGRFIEKKGFNHLIQACAILKQRGYSFQCRIIGEGPLKKNLNKLIRELGLKNYIRLQGPFSQDEIRRCLNESEVFVLPCRIVSDKNRDILANAIKEAMSMELPVITSGISGIEELITNGQNGILIPPETPELIAKELEKLFKDRDQARRLGQEARQKAVTDFDVQSESKKLSKIFESLIKK